MGAEDTPILEFDEERQRQAKAHRREAMILGFIGLGLFTTIVFSVMPTGVSLGLEVWARTLSANPWMHIALYVVAGYLSLNLFALPLRVVGRMSAVRYGLTKQSWASWAVDRSKSLALGLLFTLVTVEALYWTIRNFNGFWWLVLWVLALAFTLASGYLAPVLLLPLFYRVRKIEDDDLQERIRTLAGKASVDVIGAYEFRSSPKTERGTAALAGFGRTRRVLLSDHILEHYTGDEVEGILAHELSHHVQRDSQLYLLISAAVSLIALYLADVFVRSMMPSFGITGLSQVATLPLFVLFGTIYYTAVSPLSRYISRRREAKADRLGASLCGKPQALASALVKLHNRNLSDASPPRLVEVLFYTHPAGQRRVDALLSLSSESSA